MLACTPSETERPCDVMESIDSTNFRKSCASDETAPHRWSLVRRCQTTKQNVAKNCLDTSIHTLRSSAQSAQLSSFSFNDLCKSEEFIDCRASEEEKAELIDSLQRLHEIFPHDSYHLPVDFPRFWNKEIVLGRKLGEGSFCDVYDVLALKTSSSGAFSSSSPLSSSRVFCAERARDEEENLRYALKQLKSKTEWSAKVDLVVETRILSAMIHPNIIKVRAVAKGNPFGNSYFIILDRLYLTMEERIEMDKGRITESRRRCFPSPGNSKQNADLFHERLHYARDLSSALEYLHGHRIIHRDIKPCNVGFDLVSNKFQSLLVCFALLSMW